MRVQQPNLNSNEVKVLAALASVGGDFGVLSFRAIGRRVRLARTAIRRACRSLRRKGLSEFHRGCWTEDGEPYGSGYAATKAGNERASAKLVDKIVARMWI
jgi:hypothetical protein